MFLRKGLNIKDIDRKTKNIVFGYIRKSSDINDIEMPMVIKCMCLVYYFMREKFTQNESNNTMISSTDDIYLQNDIAISKYNRGNVYGTVLIDFKQFVNVEWTFKIKSGGNIGIGLHSMSCKYPFISYGWTSHGIQFLRLNGYGMCNQQRFNKNDVIKMELNTQDKILQFYRNKERKPQVIIKNINGNCNYKLGILMLNNESSIKLIDFKISVG